ncbi:hypothetical protein BJ165DRAFT_1458835 [Panaeolus papilionaceus]|nr:hypothetical protein BJ165DRAFT_1458835 [Panaeolus papilionaceus]
MRLTASIIPGILCTLHVTLASGLHPLEPSLLTRSPLYSIDGLLNKRQASTCPAPKITCQQDYCCQSSDWKCCSTGACCRPGTYCSVGDDGNMGCCESGSICSGSAGPPVSSTFTNTITRPPSTTPRGSATMPTGPVATTLLSSPLPTPGRQMIQIDPTDSSVSYSPGHWTEIDSPCQRGLRAMRTTTARASFTYILNEGGQWGLDGYLNAHAVDASWEVYANGKMIWPFSSGITTDCAFGDFLVLGNMLGSGLGQDTGPINFTVVVFPPGGSDNPFASPTSLPTTEFVFNAMVLEKRKNLLGNSALASSQPSTTVILGATFIMISLFGNLVGLV